MYVRALTLSERSTLDFRSRMSFRPPFAVCSFNRFRLAVKTESIFILACVFTRDTRFCSRDPLCFPLFHFLATLCNLVSFLVVGEGIAVMEDPQTPGSDCNSNPATDSIQQDLIGSEFVQDNVEYQWFIDYG